MAYSTGKSMACGMFGAIGGAIAGASMVSEGNSIIMKNGNEDPADYIAEQLMSGLTAQYQLNQLNVNSTTVESDDVELISSIYKNIDYVLDVRTVSSQTLPGSVGNRYRAMYSSKLRLIDTNKRTVVAEGFCYKAPKNSDTEYSYDELIGNNAGRAKKATESKGGLLCRSL